MVAVLAVAAWPVGSTGWAATADVNECGLVVWQDDADSGRDAGDVAEDALLLPREDAFGAFLGPRPAEMLDDRHDWFSIDLAPGIDSAMFRVRPLYLATGELAFRNAPTSAALNAFTYHLLPLRLEAWPPDGGPGPIAASPDPSGGADLELEGPAAGSWRLHVWVDAVVPPVLPCLGPLEPVPLSAPDAPSLLRDYTVYVGCNPFCMAA